MMGRHARRKGRRKRVLDFMRLLSYHNTTMSQKYLDTGRIRQKLRTRQDLLEAAWRLLSQGKQPHVAEVAEEAMVSRATAYRYFPNRERLLMEAVLDRQIAPPEEVLAGAKTFPVADRVARVQEHLFDHVSDNETLYRMFLRAGMDEWLSNRDKTNFLLRADRRLSLLDEALRPMRDRLDKDRYEKLFYALATMVSLESFIVLRDVCQLGQRRGREIMSWAVSKLVEAATADD